MTRLLQLAALVGASAALGCSTPLDDFVCSEASDCVSSGEVGVCETNGFCSFSDSACPTGRRYGSASGAESNQCVGSLGDAGVDAQPGLDASSSLGCDAFDFRILNIDDCNDLAFGPPRTLDGNGVYILDTDAGKVTTPDGEDFTIEGTVVPQINGPDLFAIALRSFHVNSETVVMVRGPRPLVVVAEKEIEIDGQLLAIGKGETPGPGGGALDDCDLGLGQSGEVQVPGGAPGGSGGGGGALGSDGGQGASVVNTDEVPTPGGREIVFQNLTPLRGGCNGGNGGANGDAGLEGVAGGGGGGAIQLVSATSISVSGYVSASGGGGKGAVAPRAGGGGGGSGGAILLQARAVEVTGALTVNGGGGGEGLDQVQDEAGDGRDGNIADTTAALGGNSASNGGEGGAGATTLPSAASDGQSGLSQTAQTVGAGGGGGGAGIIRIVEEGP